MNRSDKLDWALAQLHRSQVRLTPVREKVLAFLARTTLPATLNDLSASGDLAGQFDDTTVYRTLVLLLELEIVRQVQLQGRQAHFLLNAPGECSTFLVCRCCGAMAPVPHPHALSELEAQVGLEHGFAALTHDLVLYGNCPTCHEHTRFCSKPAKLIPGLRLHGRSN
jgi:Fe2+ or Zn2+ uptake regulation protein